MDNDDVYDSDKSSGSDRSSTETALKPTQIVRYIMYVSDAINELYRLGTLVRRPHLSGRYLHSTGVSAKFMHSTQHDYQHVRQKLLLWQRQQVDANGAGLPAGESPEDDHAITPEDMGRRDSIEEETESSELVLSRRVANANVKRRLQLRYWEAHPYRPEQGSEETPKVASKPVIATSAQTNTIRSVKEIDTTSTIAPSTVRTFSTVAMSAVLPRTLTRPDTTRTVYAPSVIGEHAPSIRVPDLPAVQDSSGLFECPFCHMMLNESAMRFRLNWK